MSEPVVDLTACKNFVEITDGILADLEANPPQTLAEAHTKLKELLASLRISIEEKSAGLKAEAPDHMAVISEVSVRVEGVNAVVLAIDELSKAEATAASALERIWKKLHAPRVEARVWTKLKGNA